MSKKTTKVLVLKEEYSDSTLAMKFPKYIEFIQYLDSNLVITDKNMTAKPCDYDYIELITLDYSDKYSLMYAYDVGERADGTLFIGKWNEGIVNVNA